MSSQHSDRRAEAWSRIDTTKTEDMVPSSELRGWLAEYVGLFEQLEAVQQERRLAGTRIRELQEQFDALKLAATSVGVVSARTTESPGESRSETSDPASEPQDDPLGYIELDEHGMCPHDYAKGLGCHICDPAKEPETYGERMRRLTASQPHGTNYPDDKGRART